MDETYQKTKLKGSEDDINKTNATRNNLYWQLPNPYLYLGKNDI